VSKSWRTPPPEGRLPKRLKYERSLEEEFSTMAEPEEIFVVIHEWEDDRYTLEETLGYHRTKAGAWLTLQAVAEGNSYYLNHDETSFSTVDNEWYIVPAVLED
jgi:hypothetical protein